MLYNYLQHILIWYPVALGLLFFPLSILVQYQLDSGKIGPTDALMIGIHYLSVSTCSLWGELPIIVAYLAKRSWRNIVKIAGSIFIYFLCINVVVNHGWQLALNTMIKFIVFLFIAGTLILISILMASLTRKIARPSRDMCGRYLDSWKSPGIIWNRLFTSALCMTLGLLAIEAAIGLVHTNRLRSSIKNADRLIVCTGHNIPEISKNEFVLFETTDKDSLRHLSEQITFPPFQLVSRSGGIPDIIFDLYKNGERSASFSLSGLSVLESADQCSELSALTSLKIILWLEETGIQKQLSELRKKNEKSQ